ncbi:MAG: DNA alkylation repair protein [Candidatus Hodarchaeota archaeon]
MKMIDEKQIPATIAQLLDQIKGEEREKSFVKELETLLMPLSKNLTPKEIAKLRIIIPTKEEFQMVGTPILEKVVRGLHLYWKQHEVNFPYKLLKELWNNRYHEYKVIVAKVLEKLGKNYPLEVLEFIEERIQDIDVWDISDQLAMFGTRQIVFKHPEIILPYSQRWVRSDLKWSQRLGVTIWIVLSREKKFELDQSAFEPVAKIIDVVVNSEDADVSKGVSWTLRELTKKNPELIFKYILSKTPPENRKIAKTLRDGAKKLPNEMNKKLKNVLSIKGSQYCSRERKN